MQKQHLKFSRDLDDGTKEYEVKHFYSQKNAQVYKLWPEQRCAEDLQREHGTMPGEGWFVDQKPWYQSYLKVRLP